jgi:D-3-phosphoglycerate dehydrogenase / 2-oxoglutarate reductase
MTENRKRLVVPDTLLPAGWEILKSRQDVAVSTYKPFMPAAEFRTRLGEADGVVLSVTPFGEADLAAAPRLKVVARMGVGYDAVDVAALTRRGVALMVVGTANSVTVAEQALFHMLALAKRGPAMAAVVRESRWAEKFAARPSELFEKTLLIIGFGRIGTRLARRCLAFEMRVLVFDPYVPAEAIRAGGCEPVAELDAALPAADYVSLHCPKTAETTRLFDAARLARMRPGAVLVNTARGGIVDEAALHAALVCGHLGGAGLDVYESEPAPADNPLFALPNVSLSPHIGGGTQEAGDRSSIAAVRNALSVLDSAPLRENVVNPEVLV